MAQGSPRLATWLGLAAENQAKPQILGHDESQAKPVIFEKDESQAKPQKNKSMPTPVSER